MSLNLLPNELLIATFEWLPSYKQKAGISRVCANWKNLICITIRENIKERFPVLTHLENLNASKLAALSEHMESLYFFAGKLDGIEPTLLFNLKETIKNEGRDNLSPSLLHFAVASNLIPLDGIDINIDKKEVFLFAAMLGNKETLSALDKEMSVQVKCSALIMAATCGQLDCLQYLNTKNIPSKDFSTDTSTHELAFRYAAGLDSLPSLKPLLKWDNSPCLKYLFEKHPAFISHSSIQQAIHSTCQNDFHFSSFKYLCEIMQETEKHFLSKNMKSLLKKSSPTCKQYLLDKKPSAPRCVIC